MQARDLCSIQFYTSGYNFGGLKKSRLECIQSLIIELIRDMNIIGPQVRALREDQDLTLKDLAFKLNTLGWDISYSLLSKIEKKKRKITDIELLFFCEAFNVKSETLLNSDGMHYKVCIGVRN